MYLYFYNYLCPLVVAEAVSLLCAFTSFKVKSPCQSMVKKISKSTFGIYILHTTPFACGLVYPLLKEYVDKNIGLYFLVLLLATLVVFLVSFIIEICREKLFEIIKTDLFLKLVDDIRHAIIEKIF